MRLPLVIALSYTVLALIATSITEARTMPIRHYAPVVKVKPKQHHILKKHHRKKHHQLTPVQFSKLIHRTHPCLANIVDHEDGTWEPTRNFGGGYGNVYVPYGLGQANPGTKMAPYGKDWRTSLWTQFRWLRDYARKFGTECQAWAHWQVYHAW